MNSVTYIAFLRGINVGGNTLVKMDDLKKTFASLSFNNIKTILASGNILFDTTETDVVSLSQKIQQILKKIYGFEITVILRTGKKIQSLINTDPFKNCQVTPNTRFHVTFIDEKSHSNLSIPYESTEKDFRILCNISGVVCSAIELSPNRGTTELMKLLEKEFGKKITTRTWNTVTKIAKSFEPV